MSKQKKIDIKYLDIPNICFSLTDMTDSREKKYAKQRKRRGFDESETWCLASTIASFIIPRLKLFMEIDEKTTIQTKGRRKAQKQMLYAFELLVRDEDAWIFDKYEKKKLNKGLKLFAKNIQTHWW